MAQILETRAGQTILAEANGIAEYLAKSRGRIPSIGAEVTLSYSGNTLQVGSGILVYGGVKAINSNTYEVSVTPTVTGSELLYVVATFNGIFDTFSISLSPTSAGNIENKTDIILGTTNIVSFNLGTLTNTTSGISAVNTTCPLADYLPDQLSNYLPLVGGTMSGPINMNGNYIYLRTGVSIQSPSAGRINLIGNIYTDAINTQGKRIDTVGGLISSGGGNINTLGGPLSCYRILLHDTNGANGEYMISYRDTTSFNVLRTMYTKEINTQGNKILTNGGEIRSGGATISADGAGLLGNVLYLHDTNGTNGASMLTYRSTSSFNVLRTMFAREIRTQGSDLLTNGGNVDTSNGDVLLGTGNLRTTGRAYFNSTNYDQIIMENATGTTGTKTVRLVHNTGPTAGVLSWDRSINGQNACYFNMISLTEGVPYNGLRMVENQRPYSYGNAKFLVEAATLFATQVSNLEISLSLQDQIDIINNNYQTLRSEVDLLKLQMTAIINGEPIPTELPADIPQAFAFKSLAPSSNVRESLETQLAEANKELMEQSYLDEVTIVDDHIKFLSEDLAGVNVRRSKPSLEELSRLTKLSSLKDTKEQILIKYGKDN